MEPTLDLDAAIETFVRGFCATRSRTHPYEFALLDGIWMMRDAPRKNARDNRKDEWLGCGVSPARLDAVARQHSRGRFFVCDLVPSFEKRSSGDLPKRQPLAARNLVPNPFAKQFKDLGYRLLASEPFFVHRLKRIPRPQVPASIVQVRSEDLAVSLGRATRTRPLTKAEMGPDSIFRQYVALVDKNVVGWVRSVSAGKSNWCSNLQVIKTHRRQGIGRALLIKMLRDDRRLGVESSVLLSSHAGAGLYPQVGYEQIGILYIYAPRKA